MPYRFPTFLIAVLLAVITPFAAAQDLNVDLEKAFRAEDYDQVLELTKDAKPDDANAKAARAGAFQRRGEARFFSADIDGAIEDFDEFLKILPDRDPHHWQRGLAYYYAGRYADGVAQFERHQTVNTQDVENAVWHFLCVVRTPEGDFEKAQEMLIPIKGDSRVPMAEVHELFAGRGTVEQVLAAAGGDIEEGGEISMRDRNHLCYAHLYLSLFYEAKGDEEKGDEEKAAEHIRLAAGKYQMDHYMGKTAQVHAKLRGVEVEE